MLSVSAYELFSSRSRDAPGYKAHRVPSVTNLHAAARWARPRDPSAIDESRFSLSHSRLGRLLGINNAEQSIPTSPVADNEWLQDNSSLTY